MEEGLSFAHLPVGCGNVDQEKVGRFIFNDFWRDFRVASCVMVSKVCRQ